MKYFILGYNQEKLIENGLDIKDALILRTFADFYESCVKNKNYKECGKDRYVWCTYGYLLNQIPIIGKERSFIGKIDTMVKKNILKKVVFNSKNGKVGKYMYLCFGSKYSDLSVPNCDNLKKEYQEKIIEKENKIAINENSTVKNTSYQMQKMQHPHAKIAIGEVQKLHIKDTSITNTSIINNIYSERKESIPPIVEDIMKKYKALGLPEYNFPPKNYVVMECLQTLGAENFFKALKIMSESEFVLKNFSVNTIFKVDNLKSVLNGSFKKRIAISLSKEKKEGVQGEKIYTQRDENDSFLEKIGIGA